MTPGLVLAGVGDLDPGYGNGGRVVTGVLAGALGDGSLIYPVASTATGSTDYAHTDINGHPDTLFGGAGRLTLPVDGLKHPGQALRTPSGQLLFTVRQNVYVSLLQLDATGHPDPSFGTAGVVHIAPVTQGCPNDIVEGLAFQPDGHLVTLVSDYGNSYLEDVLVSVAIRRFNANGSPDPTFGNGSGVVASTLADCKFGGIEGTAALNVLQGGAMDIVLPTTRRYLSADGASLAGPPASPGLRTDVAEWSYGGTLPNGDLLLRNGATVPDSSSESRDDSLDIVIARVHPDGTLDSSFGGAGTGYAQLDLGALVSGETAIAKSVQTIRSSADGKHIYIAVLLVRQCDSSCDNGHTLGILVARLLAAGSHAGTLDSSFGNSGIVMLAKAALNITDIIEQPGGAVVLTAADGTAIRLLGNAAASPGVVGTAGDYFEIPTSIGTAQVRVARTLGRDGAVSVDYATSDGSTDGYAGVAGTDYTTVSGRLDWSDGDSADKVIDIPVVHSGATTGRTFTVKLTAPTGGAWIISSDATVYIAPGGVASSSTPTATPTVPTTAAATGGGGSFGPWSIVLLSLCCLIVIHARKRQS